MKIDVFELTVEDGGILYDMEDLARFSKIYQTLGIKEYLYENQSAHKPLTHEEAYTMAEFITEKVNDYCGCEQEMVTYWYAEAYWLAKRFNNVSEEEGGE